MQIAALGGLGGVQVGMGIKPEHKEWAAHFGGMGGKPMHAAQRERVIAAHEDRYSL